MRTLTKLPFHNLHLIAGFGFILLSFFLVFGLRDIDPPLIFGLLVLLLLAVIMSARPEFTTTLILFALYANLGVIAKRNGIPDVVATSLFAALAFPTLIYVVVYGQKVIVNFASMLMVLYFAVILVSAALSNDVMDSTDRLIAFVSEGLILFVLVTNSVRTPSILRGALWALVLAGVLMGSLSLYQEITGSYDNDFGGWAEVKESEIRVEGESLIDDGETRQRLSGPIGSKNRYAQIMVVLVPLALGLMWAERRRLYRVAAAVSIIPIVGGALLTFSRGAGISLVVMLLALVVLRIVKPLHLLLVAGLLVVVVFVFVPDYVYRISTVSELTQLTSGDVTEVEGSLRGRATVNLAAIQIFVDHPLLGVGPGQTALHTRAIGNEIGLRVLTTDRRAHNMYLEELADTGVVGFAVFMGIVAYLLRRLWQIAKQAQRAHATDIYYTTMGLLLAIIVYLATAVFLHLSYVRYYWLLIALASAAVEIYGRHTSTEQLTSG